MLTWHLAWQVQCGTLTLIDLAGSEQLLGGATAKETLEGREIRKSLVFLSAFTKSRVRVNG